MMDLSIQALIMRRGGPDKKPKKDRRSSIRVNPESLSSKNSAENTKRIDVQIRNLASSWNNKKEQEQVPP